MSLCYIVLSFYSCTSTCSYHYTYHNYLQLYSKSQLFIFLQENEEFPRPILDIHYESRTIFSPPEPQSGALIIDCVVKNEYLGKGTARGVLLPLVDDLEEIGPDTLYGGVNLLTFPGSVPHF